MNYLFWTYTIVWLAFFAYALKISKLLSQTERKLDQLREEKSQN